jgi:hypothetical protein
MCDSKTSLNGYIMTGLDDLLDEREEGEGIKKTLCFCLGK